MKRLILACLLAIGITATAQEPAPAKQDTHDAAEKLLREVDARIYYPRVEGLKSVRFRWQLQGTGALEVLKKVWISYAWEAPGKIRMEYTDAQGKPLKELPQIANTDDGKNMFQHLSKQTHSMAQSLVIGIPLHEIYRDYYKELKKREVNNKVEYRVIMRPKSKKAFTRIVIKIISGLPREFTKTNDRGQEIISRYRFSKRDDKWLPSGLKVEQGSQIIMDEEYGYVIKKGLYVLSSIDRGMIRAGKQKVHLKLEALQVNTEFPPGFFEGK